jgi:crotonobetainyl-CoA:carnitine CoA-transferase CaiB-like acyl-CoA transferase
VAHGRARGRFGSGNAEIVPYQAFSTRDSGLMIAAGNDALFRKLCRALGLGHLALDPDYATNSARVANRETLIPMIAKAVSRRSHEELGAELDFLGVPNAPLLSVDEVARHPQTTALDMTVDCDGLRLMGIPLAFDARRPRAHRPAPRLGEHDEQPE